MTRPSWRLVPYDSSCRPTWDQAIGSARNGHFMFRRGFMEYHADRFTDSSLLLFRGNKVVALLPAHREGEELVSHRGLSFGGWIMAPECRYEDLESGFDLLATEMKRRALRRFVYTPTPYPYHAAPCDDDIYLLTQFGAQRQDSKLAAFLREPGQVTRLSKFRWQLKRGEEALPLEFCETGDVDRFWGYLTDFLLQRHNAEPVHSLAEISLLKQRFSENIRFVVGSHRNEWRVGNVMFLSNRVVRYQYGFWNRDEGKARMTFRLWEWVGRNPEMSRYWLDLGTSMDPLTNELVTSLHSNKENFGARGVLLNRWIWEP